MPLVPLVTNSGPSASLYAPAAGGGGGGGGGGPNLVVSSIFIASSDITGGSGGIFFKDPNIPVSTYAGFITESGPFVNLLVASPDTSTLMEVGSCSANLNNGATFIAARASYGQGGPGVPGDLQINASTCKIFADTSISSLMVSSINGAAPGGGAGPNLQVSSLAVNPTGSIVMSFDSGGPPLIFGSDAADVNKYFYLESVNPAPNGFYQSTTSGLTALEVLYSDNSVESFAPLVVGSLQLANKSGVGSIQSAFLLENNTIKIKSGDDAYPVAIDAPTTISSLSVSSINGVAPGGGSAPFFSTLNSAPSTIDCDPGTSILLSFSTTATHLYQIQTQMTIQGRGGDEGTQDQSVVQEVLNEITLNTTQGSFISSMDAAARDVSIGTCGMWKSGLTGTSLVIDANFSTTIQLGNVFLTDFGPV